MRKYLFFSWILAVVLLLSCSDDKNEQTPQTPFNEPTSEVKVYTEAEANYVAEEPSENTLVFGSNTPDNVLPKVGEIIQMPISESTPYGFLGRVISVDKSEKITVSTETVPLEEAFPNLSLDADLTEMQNVELIDEDGNPVDFYIEDIEEDSTSMKKARTRGWGVEDQDENNKYTKLSEFDWKKKKLKIPIPESWVKRFTQEKIDVSGVFELSFDGSDIKMDNKDGDTKYIDIDIRPRITVGVNLKGHIKQLGDKGKKEWKTPNLTFRGVIPGPVTFPITIPICGKAQLEGDFSTSVELRFNKYFRFHRVFNNGRWSQPESETPDVENTSPWYITEFDASGKFCFGPDVEINVGIYTSVAGLGVEFYPNGYLRANASISSLNPFEANAKVEVGVGMEWRAYCRAELFGKKVEPFSIKLPEVTFIKRTMSLFPSVSEFDAIGGSSAAEISWLTDSYYLLEPLNIVKTGTTIYKRDYTEYSSHFPEATSTDRKSQRHYNVNVTGLQAGTTYYAAPTMSVLGFKWVADKGQWKEIETEAGYKVMWRCEGREDIWNININSNTTAINLPFEAATYNDGWTKRLMVATYNPSTGILTGTVETNFYDNPGDRRIDGFTADLKKDDTGYMTNSKVLDNGACYTQIRFVKMGSNGSRARIKELPLGEDECGLGERLMH